MKGIHHVAALIWKDIRVERRSHIFVGTALVYGLLLLVMVGIALNAWTHPTPVVVSGVAWLCTWVAATYGITRHDGLDDQKGALIGILLAPVERSLIFYAKWLTVSIFLMIVAGVVNIAALLIFAATGQVHWVWFVLDVLFGCLALSAMGNLLAKIVRLSSSRHLLFQVFLFPLSVPLFLGVTRLGAYALGQSSSFPLLWLSVIIAVLVTSTVVPLLVYELVLEE